MQLAGDKLGMNKHAVGVWSVRKDACEAVARTGAGEVAARVLGHREVNSRTIYSILMANGMTKKP